MIIKSKTRKDSGSFHQMVHYLHKERLQAGDSHEPDERDFTLLNNFDFDLAISDLSGIVNGFKQNDEHRRKRRNGICLYHEMLSFHPEDTKQVNRDILMDITRKYIQTRCRDALVVAKPHFDRGHIHIHFLISGNKQGSRETMRVNKNTFTQYRRTMEEYQLSMYPSLQKSFVKSRDAQNKEKPKYRRERSKDKKVQMERKERPQSIKAELQYDLSDSLYKARSLTDFVNRVRKTHKVYEYREMPNGIIYNERKFRFTTLFKEGELAEKLTNMINGYKQTQVRQKAIEKDIADLKALRERRNRTRDRSNDREWF